MIALCCADDVCCDPPRTQSQALEEDTKIDFIRREFAEKLMRIVPAIAKRLPSDSTAHETQSEHFPLFVCGGGGRGGG